MEEQCVKSKGQFWDVFLPELLFFFWCESDTSLMIVTFLFLKRFPYERG